MKAEIFLLCSLPWLYTQVLPDIQQAFTIYGRKIWHFSFYFQLGSILKGIHVHIHVILIQKKELANLHRKFSVLFCLCSSLVQCAPAPKAVFITEWSLVQHEGLCTCSSLCWNRVSQDLFLIIIQVSSNATSSKRPLDTQWKLVSRTPSVTITLLYLTLMIFIMHIAVILFDHLVVCNLLSTPLNTPTTIWAQRSHLTC